MKSKRLIALGFILVTLGMILPYLMVIQAVPTGYFLSFLSYASTTGGLFLGLIGAATYVKENRWDG